MSPVVPCILCGSLMSALVSYVSNGVLYLLSCLKSYMMSQVVSAVLAGR